MTKYSQTEHFLLTGKIIRKFQQKLENGEITFDWNGHFLNRKNKPKFPTSFNLDFRREYGIEESFYDYIILLVSDLRVDAKRLDVMLDKPTGDSIQFRKLAAVGMCVCCGDKMTLSFDGDTIKPITKCKYPNGHPPIEVYISVPSGKLVFENYFDGVKPPSDNYLTGALDLKHETEHYAHQNIGYGACGNSCPGIFLKGKTHIIMGSQGYDDNDNIVDAHVGYKRVGGVTTDLWAWSATDIENAKKLGWKKGGSVINVKPGTYKVTQLFHLVGYDYEQRVAKKFATIEFVEKS